MHQSIKEALEAAAGRREERRRLVSNMQPWERDFHLRALRAREADRRKKKERYQKRNNFEIALTESICRQYREESRLIVLDEENPNLVPLLAIMRHNHVVGDGAISATGFRSTGRDVTAALFAYALMTYQVNASDTAIGLMWRAALLGADAAHEAGFRSFFHFDARRDEKTADCSDIRHFEAPAHGSNWKTVFNFDFMLASGGSDIRSTRKLMDFGISEEQIVILAAIAAPEGVDRLLSEFPGLRIMTMALDERLNETAYITGPGLGDAGDQSEISPADAERWYWNRILSSNGYERLLARIQQHPIAAA